MARGNEKKAIFMTDRDYEHFLKIVEQGSKRYRYKLFAYILMPNHYHLLLRSTYANLSRLMHHLNTSYTVYFNKKSARVGHLFQGRYKAILIQDDQYLLEVSRYVHLNACRAQMAVCPSLYRWSSYKFYINSMHVPEWLSTAQVLAYMSQNPQQQKKTYHNFVRDGLTSQPNPFDNVYAQTILGNTDFIAEVIARSEVQPNQEIPASTILKNSIPFDEVIQKTSIVFCIKPLNIIEGGRFSMARKITIYLLRTRTEMTLKEIGDRFKISYSAVSQTASEIVRRCKIDDQLKKTIDNINARIQS